MRLTRFIVILAMSFMFAQWAVAGFPPVRIGGILQSLVTKFTLLFPAKSVVNRGGVTAYIDTDVANLLHDGSFEGIALSSDWALSGGTATFETADKVDGNQALRITASASTPILRQTVSTKSGLPLVVGCMVKTDQNFVEICAKDNTTDVLCTNVPSDNTWRLLKFPIVAGNDGGIEVRSSQNITGNIDVDKCRVEYSDTTQDIAQSEFVFNVNIGGSSSPTISATYSSYTEITNASLDMVVNKGSNLEIPCSGTNPSTGLTCSVGSESIGVVFDAKVGIYEICASFATFTNAGVYGSYTAFQLVETPNNAQTILQEGNTRLQNGANMSVSPNNATTQALTNCGVFEFTSAGKKTIRLMLEKPNSITTTLLLDRSSTTGQRDMHITGKYYPPKSKIVTQLQEETVQTANEFSAKVSPSGVVTSENLDWINGNCSIASNRYVCNLNLDLVNPLNCSFTHNYAVNFIRSPEIFSSTNTVLTLQNRDTSNNLVIDSGFNIICQKQGADYNKSRMVYGQFEQIKTTELVKFSGSPTSAYSIGNGAILQLDADVVAYDNYNAYDAVNNRYVIPKTSVYKICAQGGVTPSGANGSIGIFVRENGNDRISRYQYGVGGRPSYPNVCKTLYLNEGVFITYLVYHDTGATASGINAAHITYLTIDELPDIAAIVKNLNDNKNVKCQTKFLSADVTTNTTGISDLGYSSLTIGKKYRVRGQAYLSNQTLKAKHDGAIIAVAYSQTTQSTIPIISREFTATTTTVTFDTTIASNTLFGDGTANETWVELCQLPDTYVETDEW